MGIEGLVFQERAAGSVKKVEKAKIGLIQFRVSPPKTDMDNQVIVSDYAAMDRVLREERAYILNIVKQIKKAGLNPISTVTELRNKHAQGEVNSGINVRKGMISNILDENVVQPLLVSTSAITLAAECVVSIMKIDDIVNTIR